MGKVKHQAGRVLVWKQNSKRFGPWHEIDGVGKLYASLNVPRLFGRNTTYPVRKSKREGRVRNPQNAQNVRDTWSTKTTP